MTSHTIAAGSTGVFGSLGAGGIALALLTFLILGVRGKGRIALGGTAATVVAFLFGTACHTAGELWSHPERFTAQGLTGLGVGTGAGVFGDVQIGAVALILLIVMLAAPLTGKLGAIVGIIAGFVWPAAGDGSIWAAPVQLGGAALMMIGGA